MPYKLVVYMRIDQEEGDEVIIFPTLEEAEKEMEQINIMYWDGSTIAEIVECDENGDIILEDMTSEPPAEIIPIRGIIAKVTDGG